MNNRTALLLYLDVAMLVLVCVLECVPLTGLELHEWLGFLLCPLVFVHVVLQFHWFVTQLQRIRKTNGYRVRINALLNLALLFLMSAVLVSGALVSNQIAATIGESLGKDRIWREIHGWANFSLIVLVGLHLALNWDWMVAALRRRRLEKMSVPVASNLNSPVPAQFSRTLRLSGRCLAVLAAVSVAAGAAYFAMATITVLPEKLAPTQNEPYTDISTSGQNRFVPRARPADLPDGLEKLAVTTAAIALTVIVGRYVFRLRL